MYAAVLADKNNEAKWELSPCNSSIYVCGINSKEEQEEENVDVVMVTEKRQTQGANFVKRTWGKYFLAC